MASIDRDSVEVRVFTVSAKDVATGQPVDITSDTVYVAFTSARASDRPSNWIACSRDADNTQLVEVPFGPSGFQLDPGAYRRWVRFTDGAETPVFVAADRLTVT